MHLEGKIGMKKRNISQMFTNVKISKYSLTVEKSFLKLLFDDLRYLLIFVVR